MLRRAYEVRQVVTKHALGVAKCLHNAFTKPSQDKQRQLCELKHDLALVHDHKCCQLLVNARLPAAAAWTALKPETDRDFHVLSTYLGPVTDRNSEIEIADLCR